MTRSSERERILTASRQAAVSGAVIAEEKRNGRARCLNQSIIIFLPADLESNPCEDIPKLYAKLTEGYDFVLGWRQNKNVGLIKSITTKLLHISVKILFGIKLHDLSWIKAFKRKILEEMPQLRSDWQKFFAVIAYYQGFRVTEVKTNWYPRKHGKSNFGKFGLKRIPASFSFETKICEVDSVCPLDSYSANVYANEVIISSTLLKYSPRKFKIFMWEK